MIPPYAGFGEQGQWPLHPQMPPSLSLTGCSERSELCTPPSSFPKLLVPGTLAGTLLATPAYPSLGIPLWEALLCCSHHDPHHSVVYLSAHPTP